MSSRRRARGRGEAEAGFLLNHLISAADQRRRKLVSELLGGLEVDDELQLGDKLDREIRRLLALEYPSGIDAGAPMRLRKIPPIAHQAARVGEVPGLGNRGHAIFGGKLGQQSTAKRKIRVRGEDESTR